MRGRLQAMVAASILAMLSLILPPLTVLGSGAVALVTLRKGAREGLNILACSSIGAVIGAILANVPVPFLVNYTLIPCMAWSVAIILRESQHLSLAVEAAIVIGIACMVGIYAFITDPAVMWKEAMVKMVPDNAPIVDAQHMIDAMAPDMTGIATIGGVFSVLLSLLLARWWQAALYNPGGFRKEFLALKIQPKLAMVNLAIIALAFVSSGTWPQESRIIINLMVVLYVFVGIAVLHTIISDMKMAQYALPMFYIALFMLMPRSVFLVALLGLSDTWLDVRKRTLNQS